MTPPVFGLRPILAARLRASKLPNPVICTLEPFFSSLAMMPLSSNNASTVRVASAFDIFVRMARAEVSSALFTAISLWGGRENPHQHCTTMGYPSENRKIPSFLRGTRRHEARLPEQATVASVLAHVPTCRRAL